MWRPDAPRVGNDVLAVRQGCGVNIDPKDIREGDRVRVTDARSWAVVVTHADDGWIRTQGMGVWSHNSPRGESTTRTWELIERPKLEATLGTVWVDPFSGARWVSIGRGQYAGEAPASGRLAAIVGPWNDQGRAVIARLVPAAEEQA